MRFVSGYVVILAVVIGVSMGTAFGVHITNHFEGDVTIDQGGESGNLILNDGRLGIGATPSATQIIRAESDSGTPARFLVVGNQASGIFNLKSIGGIPAVQITDGDTGQAYRMRIDQSSQDMQFVDVSGDNQLVRISIDSAGNVCIGDC